MNDCKYGETCTGQTRPNLPIVIAVFSNKVFGVFGRLMISTSGSNRIVTYVLVSAPSCIAISPIAQMALLHTEMYSGFKFWLSTCIKSFRTGRMLSKQAFVKSPSKAKELWRTSDTVSFIQANSSCKISLLPTRGAIRLPKP